VKSQHFLCTKSTILALIAAPCLKMTKMIGKIENLFAYPRAAAISMSASFQTQDYKELGDICINSE
jgi:hypothetical protein